MTRSPPAWGLHQIRLDNYAQPWPAYPPTRCCNRQCLVHRNDPRLSSQLQDGPLTTVHRGSMPAFRRLKGSTDHNQKTHPVGQLRLPLSPLSLFPHADGRLSLKGEARQYRRPSPDALPRDSERNHLAHSLNHLFVQTLLPFLHRTEAISCYSPDRPTGRAPSLPRYLSSLEFRS